MAAALLIVVVRRRRIPGSDSKVLLAALLVFSLLYGFFLVAEWTGLATTWESVEDVVGSLVAMTWGFFFYSLAQEALNRKLAAREQEVRDSRRRLATLMDNLPGMAYRCRNDLDWTMEFVSVGSVALTGYDPEELVENRGGSYGNLIHPEDREAVWDTVQRSLEAGGPFHLIYRITAKDSSEKWVWEQGVGVFSSEGELSALEGFVTDITHIKETELALNEARRKLADILNFLPDPTFSINNAGEVIIWNQAMEELTGVPAHRMLGRGGCEYSVPFWGERRPSLADFVLKWDESSAIREYPALIREKDTVITEVFAPVLEENGRYLWIKAKVLLDESGKPTAAIETLRDVSSRKELEKKLKKAADEYQMLFSNLPVGVITVDADLRITRINREGEKITGFQSDEVVGRPCREVMAGAMCDSSCPIRNALAKRSPVGFVEGDISHRNGTRIPVRVNAGCLFSGDGGLMGGIEVFQDITEIKQLEEEKAKIISMFAHDMKSPLIGIHGFAAHLLSHTETLPADKKTQFLEIIGRESGKLETLINDFLDFSRLNLGRLKLNFDSMDLSKELHELIETFEPRFQDAGIRLRAKNIGELPEIEGDAPRLRRVFTNLLENALKYSESGTRVTVEAGETALEVLIRFEDQGIGINSEELPHVFNMFYRGRKLGHREGHGLGLAGVESIVNGHGGRVMVCSVPGQGSVFVVALPKSREAGEV